MSTSLSPRSSGSSGHPTRQQLDELDALLQRMLALPVNQAGDDVDAEIKAVAKASPPRRPDPVSYRTPDYRGEEAASGEDTETNAAPAVPPRLDAAHLPAADETHDADNWVPLSSTWKPSPHTWKPLAQSWQKPRETTAAQETPVSREETIVVPAPKPMEPAKTVMPPAPVETKRLTPPLAATSSDSVPPLALWQRLLIWFNGAFDLLLLPWGMPGRWLRREGGGRNLLGVAGFLMLLAAAGLVAMQWFGWTWEDVLARIR